MPRGLRFVLKISGFVVLVAGLVWSWTLLNSPSKMNTQLHAEIQSKLAILIEETIKAKKPNSSDFELSQMYTSAVSETLVSAHFSYKFKDFIKSDDAGNSEGVEQSITGYALLEKAPSENPDLQKWVIQSIKTNQQSVSFNEGMVVTADGNETPTETTAPAENN